LRKPRANNNAKRKILFMSGSLRQFTPEPITEQSPRTADTFADYWMVTVTVFFER
jgi:hypothetical protein